jgi:MarR family transcriptional regulator, transcriptional regulator for hemolysin
MRRALGRCGAMRVIVLHEMFCMPTNGGSIHPMSTSVATPPPVLADDLCWLLARASQLLTAEFGSALEASDGISLRQHTVLATAMTGEHTQTDLARMVGLDKTTMMVTLDELERAGLAQRCPVPSDRRARLVAVTPAGERAVRAANEILARIKAQVLALLPAEQRDGFLQSLGCLACSENVGSACAGMPASAAA